MPTPIYATFGDVQIAYEGTIPASDQARVESLIKRASARLTRMMPSVPPRLQRGELDADLPAGLVIEAVLRVYRNPEGITAEEIGPFHKQFNARSIAAEVTLDPDEVHALLAPIDNPLRPSIQVGMSTRAQQLYELGGVDWPIEPCVADSGRFTDALTVH